MSWIDKLEQRVGLRPAPEPERPLTPSERADVAEMSNEAVALVQGLLQQFPELAKSPDVRAAADKLMEGHESFLAMLAEEDDDVPHD
jgi:hypothetical protein